MEKYIVNKDLLVWMEKKKSFSLSCIAKISKILNNDSLDKENAIKQTIDEYDIKAQEIADFFKNMTDKYEWKDIISKSTLE